MAAAAAEQPAAAPHACKRAKLEPGPDLNTPGAFAYMSRGRHTYQVSMALHAENRRRVAQRMRDAGHTSGLIFLKGGGDDAVERYDTDYEGIFRQESYFNWLFGVELPGWYGAVDVATGEATLFMPRLEDIRSIWSGANDPPEFFQRK